MDILKKTFKDCFKQSRNDKKSRKRTKHERPVSKNKKKSKNMPQIALARTLIQILQPATVRVHSSSKAHADFTDSR